MKVGNKSDSLSNFQLDIEVIKLTISCLFPKGNVVAVKVLTFNIILMLTCSLVMSLAPLALGELVDDMSRKHGSMAAIPIGLIVAYPLIKFLSSAMQQFQFFFSAQSTAVARQYLANRTLEHLYRLGARFHLNFSAGGGARLIQRGSESIERLVRVLIFTIGPIIFQFFFSMIVVWHSLLPSVFALIVATLGSYAVIAFWLTKWQQGLWEKINNSDTEMNGMSVDILSKYNVVKYFCNEKFELIRFGRLIKEYADVTVKNQLSISIMGTLWSLFTSASILLVLYVTCLNVLHGGGTAGAVVMAEAYMMQLFAPLGALGLVYRDFRQSIIDLGKVREILNEIPEIDDAPGASSLENAKGQVRFENVSFRYEANNYILKNISFEVNAGQRLAIVGPSGSGKSTITKLLYRFYDVSDGAITIDGYNIKDITQRSLRSALSIVPQDIELFDDTIFFNIAYSRPEAAQSEVAFVESLAELSDVVQRSSGGLLARIGVSGMKLSGGERQRLAIARMILRDSPVLIFDEATSSLDGKTELSLRGNMEKFQRNRTSIVIAHRLATIIDADEILYLEKGQILERGNHLSLLALNGSYAKLWSIQNG